MGGCRVYSIHISCVTMYIMQVDNLRGICGDLLCYDVLQKRKVFFDALSDGLEVFHLKAAVNAFPILFEPLFVASGKCLPGDVLGILRFEQALEGNRERVSGYLKNFIGKLSEPGECVAYFFFQ